eukprot:COSAG02_NODE_5322_length_4438_cov_62.060152_1_plen_62_part_00
MAPLPVKTPAQRALPLLLVLLIIALAFAGGLVRPPWQWKSYTRLTAAVSGWWVEDEELREL